MTEVVADVHEKAGIDEILAEMGVVVREESGFGADYVAGEYVVERKRWRELPGRITTSERDLRWQLQKTAAAAEELGLEPALLVEGPWGEPFEHSALGVKHVERYLHRLHDMGVWLMVTSCDERTADLLRSLAEEEAEDPTPVRDAPNVPEEDAPRYLVEGFRGVGPKTADGLLDEFGTARAVFTADEGELREVDGVGPKTAGRIVGDATRRY